MVTNYYDGEKCYTNEENVNGTYEENKMENNDGDFSDSEYSPSNDIYGECTKLFKTQNRHQKWNQHSKISIYTCITHVFK